jgi:hypothetical protein
MVRGAGMVQLFDRFFHVVMDRIQIVPVMHPVGNRDPGNERQTHRKNGNGNRFLHSFPLQIVA